MADCTQAAPQSCRNSPTPSRPLAPNVGTVFSGGPLLEQLAGITGNAASPITCIGNELAFSPAIVKSTTFTGPQVNPSANCWHSTSGLPLASTCCGSASPGASTDEIIRNPTDPVSTRMWSMV